jgi:hypothetical protein
VNVPAIIRLAPILRLEDLDELQRRGRDVFEWGSFKPLLEPVPVVVDHGERELGQVREFAYREAPERERGVWAFAHCLLHDVPGWLRRGTPASFESILPRIIDLGGINRVLEHRVREVTVCSPRSRPVEPLARVELIGAEEAPAVAAITSARAAGEIPSPGVRVLRRNVGQVLGVR